MNSKLRLSQEKLYSYLKHNVELTVLDTVGSTNSYAKEKAGGQVSTNQVCLIVADEQTAGRGRLGRSFASKKGTGVFMTLSLYPKFPIEKAMLVTPLSSLAVKHAVSELLGIELGIKWVNDMILDSKKVGGILVEVLPSDKKNYTLVIGIGINCFRQVFSEELKEIATSLEEKIDLSQYDYFREQLCANITDRLLDYISELDISSSEFGHQSSKFGHQSLEPDNSSKEHVISSVLTDYMNEYRASSVLIGKEVYVLNSALSSDPVLAHVIDIDDKGSLIVRLIERNEVVTLSTGEVSIRLR